MAVQLAGVWTHLCPVEHRLVAPNSGHVHYDVSEIANPGFPPHGRAVLAPERLGARSPDPKQRWLTFVHNHAKVIVACDFFVVITATFRTLSVFVLMEVGTRRLLHHNVNVHPTAEWTLQQFRETLVVRNKSTRPRINLWSARIPSGFELKHFRTDPPVPLLDVNRPKTINLLRTTGSRSITRHRTA